MEHVKEADNVVHASMLTILNTAEALGHSAKSELPEGSVFTTTQANAVSGPPESVSGLAAGEQELFTVQILRRCWMTAVSQPTKPFENKVDQ